MHTFLYGHEETEEVDVDSAEWPKQRTANVIFLLQIIRTLVSPDNNSQNTHAAQKVLNQTSTKYSKKLLTKSVIYRNP